MIAGSQVSSTLAPHLRFVTVAKHSSVQMIDLFPYYAAVANNDASILLAGLDQSMLLKLQNVPFGELVRKDVVWGQLALADTIRDLIAVNANSVLASSRTLLMSPMEYYTQFWFPQWVIMTTITEGKLDLLESFLEKVRDLATHSNSGQKLRSAYLHGLAYVVLYEYGYQPSTRKYNLPFDFLGGGGRFRISAYMWAKENDYHQAADALSKIIRPEDHTGNCLPIHWDIPFHREFFRLNGDHELMVRFFIPSKGSP
ncbi:hypothetical protein IWQ60_009243 [Tieghemiomyces parasiticus]|uniref:Uncharacterized protein n=1 Tax=Tieghemiomyces parasiticus TaxID=78921 RepID=A0A9W7ZNS7_9FUNG|nr:hypothetical protein IWQ60_009243 [Tieghemiomyces parasiticus]